NTVVIMTSNIGSSHISEENSEHDLEDIIMVELRKHFKPELLNRIDDIVIFHSLDDSHFYGIAQKMLGELAERMKQQQLSLEVDDSVIEYIVEAGTDPIF